MNWIFFSIALLLSVNTYAQSSNHRTITGSIAGVPDATLFYLIKNTDSGRPDTVLRSTSRDQRFEFKIENGSIGQIYFIKIDTTVNAKIGKGKKTAFRMFLDDSNITITGNVKEWPNLQIQGSPATDVYEAYFKLIEPYKGTFNSAVNSGDTPKIRIARNELIEVVQSYLSKYPDSYAIPSLLTGANILSLDMKKAIYGKLTERVKNGFYGERAANLLIELEKGSQIAQGRSIPDFSIKDENGKVIPIIDLIKKNKYTLIDFWASWCKPCRDELPNLKHAYSKYHESGFNIISVSIDKIQENWIEALRKEKMQWANGIQVMREASTIFDLKSIPAYLLVDSTGKMISFQSTLSNVRSFGDPIRGEHLALKIDRLLSN